MVLGNTIAKSKKLFRKTLGNLKSFFCGGYKKLPKTISFNPFYCGRDLKYQHPTDHFYADFYDEWESTLGNRQCSPKKIKQEGGLMQMKQTGSSHLQKGEARASSQNANAESYTLARRMKEFEMVDSGDVEQVLDVEEALHYYSRLKSPAYLDIVDKFFLDMYADFSIPPAPVSVNNSKRRLSSQRLGSMRL
ncbi:ATP-dependent RNA helicase DDX11 [Pyrus ussuriensis x Pyrus communis]|uniref:ATP-dependent RNA helicase DDX11 n=1 Tax=Pyrus ussuriensis x Pyrus communis TaxID=2448454 RepID=A0A5N5GCD9_9ROSA|nr:ATP-dependent RNA helicase DDX11 [Pyrus ussuriensis x Pyrus communis]